MDHDIAVILYDPFAGFVAFNSQPTITFRVEANIDLFANGVDLPAAVAGAEDEEIVQGRDASHVEDFHVACLVVHRHAGRRGIGAIKRIESQGCSGLVSLRLSKDPLPGL